MSLKIGQFKKTHFGSCWLDKLLCHMSVFLCLLLLSGDAFASAKGYKLKAAYLYQFTKFTQWPSRQFVNKTTPIRICVLGRNPFGDLLDSFSSRESQHRQLLIKYLSSLQNIASCHVVFISKSEEKRLTQILSRIANSPVLSVSDMEGFAKRGGIIGFVPKSRRIGIEINVAASRSSGAKLSSKLLEVATLVKGRVPGQLP